MPPKCSKVLEKIVFEAIFAFKIENKLLSNNDSNFKPNDSRVILLFSITYGFLSAFDSNLL